MTARIGLTQIASRLAPRFAERAAKHDADDSFVAENFADLKETRAFSAHVPQQFGGGGASHTEICAFLRRLGRACPSTALALSMHQHLVAAAVVNWQAGRAGPTLLEKVGRGEKVLVSTGANDWLDSNGAAERVDGGYRVTAVKPFASSSPMGDIMVTSAVCGDQVLHFPAPLDAAGVAFMDDWKAMGMRGTGSQTIRLNGVFVPEDMVVLTRDRGPFHPAFAVILAVAMPIILSAYLGAGEAAAAMAQERAQERRDAPEVQALAGELENQLAAAETAVESMIALAAGYDFEPTRSLAAKVLARKTQAANAVIGVAGKAMELAGGSAYFRKTGIERYVRDLHGAQFHPLPEKPQTMFCGRIALGLDPVEQTDLTERRKAA